jgi:hypothetical protein
VSSEFSQDLTKREDKTAFFGSAITPNPTYAVAVVG